MTSACDDRARAWEWAAATDFFAARQIEPVYVIRYLFRANKQNTPPVSHDSLLPMVLWWVWAALQLVPVAWYVVARDSQQE